MSAARAAAGVTVAEPKSLRCTAVTSAAWSASVASCAFDSTLIVWHSEFGRLPISERMDGRDHNAAGFSVWLAGGGVKGGTIVGSTDQYGYRAVENPKTVYDLHATILRLVGLDFEKLTYRFNGRDMRLTDVHGHLIPEVLA